ncbi:aconitase X [Mesorhizobium sp. M0751]|uniref:aconitase X n=1 Tax=unclassified Mesorhizobium TaxID=325217 RepID=UPI00333B8A8C
MSLELNAGDQSMLQGEQGPAVAAAMKILVAFSKAVGAHKLLDIAGAHIDGCLYHGQASLDFVERLIEGGGRVRVPTTLNVGSFDLIHPGLVKMPVSQEAPARRLMKAHLELGCQATFTCAPYQTRFRPRFGEQIAWGESNAIVFANSVIGARTNRYGDFIDLCCAITGRAPAWGLHLSENRRGQILFELIDAAFEPTDALFVGVGLIVGQRAGDRIPVISGLPQPRDEDQLKALGAAAATTGAVALFHAVGITPEAETLDEALHGLVPEEKIRISRADIHHALVRLSSVPDGVQLAAVSLGTPHFSHEEWMRLLPLLREVAPGRGVPIYVNTGRATLTRLQDEGALAGMEEFGLVPVTDTCTYVTSILERLDGVVMTNSGKWAHYAPGNIGVSVAFGDMEDCVRSAAAARVVRAAP